MMNKLVIIGNLVRDPETRTAQSGSTVCSFTVAVNRRRSADNQPDADFFRVSAWNKLGEVCQKYLAKGRKVCVVGSVSVNSYEAKDGTARASLDVCAQEIEFLSPREQSDADDSQGDAGYSDGDVSDDDLPF